MTANSINDIDNCEKLAQEFWDKTAAMDSLCEEYIRLRITSRKDSIDAQRYRKLRIKHWEDGGLVIARNASRLQLGTQCISDELLDEYLDCTNENP